jgi:hypothetical protein
MAIVKDPPHGGVEEFARRVREAEGLGEVVPRSRLFRALCAAVAAFPRIEVLRLVWPDGAIIAEVEVSFGCKPLETMHVIGTYRAGPGFEHLAGGREQMSGSLGADLQRGAFGLFSGTDELDMTAIDEIGRPYDVFAVAAEDRRIDFGIAPQWTSS